MIIALAQIRSKKGNIDHNLKQHILLAELAALHGAQLILFPELSLSSYEPKLAEKLAFETKHRIIQLLQSTSQQHNIVIGAGFPERTPYGIRISQVFAQPYTKPKFYSKQHLHRDELPYFTPGNQQLILKMGRDQLAPAICYESLQENHVQKAHSLGANVYVASVAKDQNGINQAVKYYPAIAKNYSLDMLMVNSVGFCDNFNAAGQSAVWDKKGNLRGQLDPSEEALLFFDKENAHTFKKTW